MDYQKHYDALMDRARTRKLKGYGENHHIIPRCVGGTNEKDNIARLTPEEHYVAHQLLVKMYPENLKLLWAASNMTGKARTHVRNNKLYGWLRRRLAEKLTGRVHRPESIEKMRGRDKHPGRTTGFVHTEDTKRKMSLASKGKAKSVEHVQAMSLGKQGKKRGKHSEQWHENQVASMNTPEYKARFSALMREKWAIRKADPDYAATRAAQMQRTWETRRQRQKKEEQLLLL